jgi:CAAX prenyl protease-like protein
MADTSTDNASVPGAKQSIFAQGGLLFSPVAVRVVPFAVFAGLTMIQGRFGETGQYWIYALKTVIAAYLLWMMRRHVQELKWKLSWEAVVVGALVFVAWIGLDGLYPTVSVREGRFNPIQTYGPGAFLGFMFIGVRIVGSALIVPMLEEVFYRSFLYRYIIQVQFLNIPLGRFDWKAFIFVGAAFGIGHFEWLPGILCAFAYQTLVWRKNRLGDALSAHAITNLLLGIWVVARGDYLFW